MINIGLYLANDSDEFPKQAIEWSKETGAVCFPMRSVDDLTEHADSLPDSRVGHFAIFCHGTTQALGRPGRWGVDIRPARRAMPDKYLSPEAFSEAWAPTLAPGALVSLCACLCGRSQHWYLTKLYGKAISPWGQVSYENGGQTSFAMRLMKALVADGVEGVRVRAHCAAGHCTYQALLREYRPGMDIGLSLFRLVVGPSVEWSRKVRNRWQDVVKGQLSERWLLGDDSVVEEIRGLL